jgi:diguanylate cyclase (GGDEF)-like protein
MLPQDLEQRLRAQIDFPSPPQVATEIITLARDPDIEMAKVATAVGRDPAMTAKILRIANSAFYAQRRPSQNLRQALVIIGLNAALTLALSFSLVSSMRALRATGIDYSRFWRRALLAATAARAFSEAAKTGHQEDVFLAAMLQDMGVLALDRAARDFYSQLPQKATHADWVAYEIAKLGKDHSFYTAMMLRAWNLPERLCKPVEASHSPQMFAWTTEEGQFARCVALGSDLAEAVLSPDRANSVPALAQRAHRLLSMSHEHFNEVVARILSLIPETEALYETPILEADDADNLLAEARELLAVRNLHALQEVTNLQATTSALQTRTEEAEDSSRRDPLTGVLNRPWLDRMLDREFTQAVVFGRDLSVAHIDLDRFKLINEKHGTPVGDKVLHSCAQTIQGVIRGSDLVARFGGEEFIVVLPSTDRAIARQVAQRILAALAGADHGDESVSGVHVTASIGVATYTTNQRFPSTLALLEAADHALYAAKLCGRNRVECYDELPTSRRSSGAARS